MKNRPAARGSAAVRVVSALAAVGAVVALLLGAACADGGQLPSGTNAFPPPRPTLTSQYRPSGHAAAGDAFVHLFQWTWVNVATECETVLGPAGWKGVQVSPPQEHATGNPAWHVVYAPVSYSIAQTKSGTAAEFTDMVARCRAAGVDIYVDAVINHMTGGSGTGSNGTVYTKYNYPGLYTATDFHTPCGINSYQYAAQVQDCELLGLSDLNTGMASVRQKIADYLLTLVRLGVAGFRIDAAKHIQPVELDSILSRVNATLVEEGRPRTWLFGEVIDYGGGEAVQATDYYGLGYASGGASDITEFRYRGVADRFLNLNGRRASELARFNPAGWGLMPSDKALVFLENHDTQRSDGIGYRDGSRFRLANVFLLAYPYGFPSVLSGYGLDRTTQGGRDQGPPFDAANPQPVTCAASLETALNGQFVCEHRDPTIARMVRFRRVVAGEDVNTPWDDGADAMAFSRGTKGFVALNNGTTVVTATIASSLAAGTYCDVLTGGMVAGACAGRSVVVAAGGVMALTLQPGTAVALHVVAKL